MDPPKDWNFDWYEAKQKAAPQPQGQEYPEYPTGGTEGTPGAGGDTWSYGGEDVTGDITLPENWTTATDYLKGLLSGGGGGGGGGGAGGGGAWGMAQERAGQMLGTGEPVDIAGWWEAQKPVYQQEYEDQARQLAEQAGLGGMRWSSVLQRNIADMTQRGQTQLTAEAMSQQLAADEAAKQRVLETMGILNQIGSGQASARSAGAGRRLSTIGMLLGAGQDEARFNMDLINQMAGLGQGQYGMEQQQYQNIYDPAWMQSAIGLSGQGAAGLPQTYEPSIWENLAGAASYIPGLIGAAGGGGAGGAGSSYAGGGGSYNPQLTFKYPGL